MKRLFISYFFQIPAIGSVFSLLLRERNARIHNSIGREDFAICASSVEGVRKEPFKHHILIILVCKVQGGLIQHKIVVALPDCDKIFKMPAVVWQNIERIYRMRDFLQSAYEKNHIVSYR